MNGVPVSSQRISRDKNAPSAKPGEVQELQILDHFSAGPNVFTILQNTPEKGDHSPVLVELEVLFPEGKTMRVTSGTGWKSGYGFSEDSVTGKKLQIKNPEFVSAAWFPAIETKDEVPVENLKSNFVLAIQPRIPARAALMKADLLMRTLGRPNRDQIVTSRPQDLSTLEALDLAAGQRLSQMLSAGAGKLSLRKWESNEALVDWLFATTLARNPAPPEKEASLELLSQAGPQKQAAVEDLLWSVFALPEFQLIR
jgi:hypothetical protein